MCWPNSLYGLGSSLLRTPRYSILCLASLNIFQVFNVTPSLDNRLVHKSLFQPFYRYLLLIAHLVFIHNKGNFVS